MIAKWIKENFDQMDEVEKWVAWFKFLKPIKEGRFNIAREGEIEMDDSANLGRPLGWAKQVKDQMKKLGVWAGSVTGYSGVQTQEPVAGTLGEPVPVGEDVERQIERIERLLQEKDPNYDLRIYSIQVDVSVQDDLGGETQETQTEIRGIPGVTTVRTSGTPRSIGNTQLSTYEIKFELLGTESRVRYRDSTLIPGLMKVRGLRVLRVSPIHRTNVRGTIRTVREILVKEGGLSGGGFGGGISQMPNLSRGPMVTPRLTIKQALEDWVGGVMPYDVPMDTNQMSYHVMTPVSELLPYISREFRAPKDAFDGMYQHFVSHGPSAPVYVALGKNGRVKITGNEDIIWYAKRAGLEEVPVFYSYQRQV